MAHAGIYATLAQCAAAVGELVDGTGWVEGNINGWCLEAEGLIHCVARKVFATIIADYTAMPAGGKAILADIEANYVAMQGIKYNMAGYTSRVEAEDMINVCRDNVLRGLSLIRDQKVVAFIVTGA